MLREFIVQAKALSDETRVRMLKLLQRRELCVCQVMAVLELGQSTASKHLGILKNAGLIESRKRGTWTLYRISEKTINTYNAGFLKLTENSLGNDPLMAADLKKLKNVLKKDMKNFCDTGMRK